MVEMTDIEKTAQEGLDTVINSAAEENREKLKQLAALLLEIAKGGAVTAQNVAEIDRLGRDQTLKTDIEKMLPPLEALAKANKPNQALMNGFVPEEEEKRNDQQKDMNKALQSGNLLDFIRALFAMFLGTPQNDKTPGVSNDPVAPVTEQPSTDTITILPPKGFSPQMMPDMTQATAPKQLRLLNKRESPRSLVRMWIIYGV